MNEEQKKYEEQILTQLKRMEKGLHGFTFVIIILLIFLLFNTCPLSN